MIIGTIKIIPKIVVAGDLTQKSIKQPIKLSAIFRRLLFFSLIRFIFLKLQN